jgi:hypothetical protein
MTKVALRWTPEGKRKRGRPKTTWRHNRRKVMEAGESVDVFISHPPAL